MEALEARNRFDVIFDCYGAFRRARVPVVGIVQGRAHGFGAALAALCDITLAADSARFCVPEMRNRILPTMVASAFAGRVSPKALLYLLYSTEEIGAERALTFGLVSEIAPAAGLEAAVAGLVERLSATPRDALIGLKDFARVGLAMDTDAMVAFARNLHATVNTSSSLRR
jgi:enoyl-CoA hydratase/carnithine racemase